MCPIYYLEIFYIIFITLDLFWSSYGSENILWFLILQFILDIWYYNILIGNCSCYVKTEQVKNSPSLFKTLFSNF